MAGRRISMSSRDHPRSRGVYLVVMRRMGTRRGSSPLARGLRKPFPSKSRNTRIIPARAGFTLSSAISQMTLRDHPRSRGVYVERVMGVSLEAGIIPARAGFTTCAPWSDWSPPDHPRSRGVYAFVERSHMWEWGSSPLARGLREDRVPGGYQFGIIPARAGFTRRPPLRRGPSPDHPRSRGVYLAGFARWLYKQGSSPLARGLPSQQVAAGVNDGIIPARAGFTCGCHVSSPSRADHPRSRGVY